MDETELHHDDHVRFADVEFRVVASVEQNDPGDTLPLGMLG